MADPAAQHRDHARHRRAGCAVLTISDSRSPDRDASGDRIAELLADAGHVLADRALVPDDPAAIAAAMRRWIDDEAVDAVLSTGGTGLAVRDVTVDVIRPMLTCELEGFGELMRMLSFEQVGAAAMLSRAIGGLVTSPAGRDTFVFAMPGSPNAVGLAMTRLILPELGHLIWLRRPDST
jgi:molybdenum cofactor biosynthesis protein B